MLRRRGSRAQAFKASSEVAATAAEVPAATDVPATEAAAEVPATAEVAAPAARVVAACVVYRLHAERVVVDVDRFDALLREVAVAVGRERRARGEQRRP